MGASEQKVNRLRARVGRQLSVLPTARLGCTRSVGVDDQALLIRDFAPEKLKLTRGWSRGRTSTWGWGGTVSGRSKRVWWHHPLNHALSFTLVYCSIKSIVLTMQTESMGDIWCNEADDLIGRATIGGYAIGVVGPGCAGTPVTSQPLNSPSHGGLRNRLGGRGQSWEQSCWRATKGQSAHREDFVSVRLIVSAPCVISFRCKNDSCIVDLKRRPITTRLEPSTAAGSCTCRSWRLC